MTYQKGRAWAEKVFLIALLIVSLAQSHARAQQPNRAGLIVDFGNGVVTTRCVEFNEPEITGYEVLKRSGLRIVADETTGMGVTICDIGTTSGCSAANCFCRCQGIDCNYWIYYQWEGGAWRYSPLGASATTVQPGDVEGWIWGEGNPSGGTLPPNISYDQICASGSGIPPATGVAPPASEAPATLTTVPPTATPLPSPSSTMTPTKLPPTRVSPTSTVQPATEATATVSAPPPIQTTEPTFTPSSTPEIEAPSTPAQENTPNAKEEQGRIALPIEYAAFGLMVVGLVGWLIYVLRSRRHRA